MNYRNKKITIMGLGRMAKGAGISAALYFAQQKAKVIVTDLRPLSMVNQDSIKRLRKYRNVKIILGRHRLSDFQRADIVFKNPAVKDSSEFLKLARKNHARIITDLGLFFDYLNIKFQPGDIKVIGITGTRGKSTITSLIYTILKSKYKNKVYLGGNIGISPINFMAKLKKGDIVVLEVASFQLHNLSNHHFDIAVVTNIYPDHLDYYKNCREYIKDKEKIFSSQAINDYLVVNRDDLKTRAMAQNAKSQVIYFSKNKKIKLKDIKLIGEHNLYNIDAAWKVGETMGVSEGIICKVVKKFSGVANRLELIRDYKGVKFYNDTTATHPQATVAALQALPKKRIILISGGNSKNIPLTVMMREIKKRVKYLILYPGNANLKLPPGITVNNLKDAVQKSWNLAKKGDIILFSPGLTWLPAINEFARGKIFIEESKRIHSKK